MTIHYDNIHKYFNYVDFYLEEIARLATASVKDEVSKYKVIEILGKH